MTIDQLVTRLEKGINIDYTNALEKAALLVENEAKRTCPVDTGELRNSIHHEVNGNEATVGTNKEYAPYVEYGTGLFAENGDGRKDVPWRYQSADGEWHTTSGQHPQPFLRPALENNQDKILEIIGKEIANSIARSLKDTEA